MSNVLTPAHVAEILARAVNPGPENVSSACTGQCGDIPDLAESHEALRAELAALKAKYEPDCYCVCHSQVSSRPSCEHCKGINEVSDARLRRELAALKATVEAAPHGRALDGGFCGADKCAACRENADMCELEHAKCPSFRPQPCNCWKSKVSQ